MWMMWCYLGIFKSSNVERIRAHHSQIQTLITYESVQLKKKRIRNAKREAGEFSMRRIEAEPNFVEIYDDKFIHTMHMLHMHL